MACGSFRANAARLLLAWEPWLIWTHALSDIGIGVAYFTSRGAGNLRLPPGSRVQLLMPRTSGRRPAEMAGATGDFTTWITTSAQPMLSRTEANP